jgi:hypothetical protein
MVIKILLRKEVNLMIIDEVIERFFPIVVIVAVIVGATLIVQYVFFPHMFEKKVNSAYDTRYQVLFISPSGDEELSFKTHGEVTPKRDSQGAYFKDITNNVTIEVSGENVAYHRQVK